jgi:hypothetical protein
MLARNTAHRRSNKIGTKSVSSYEFGRISQPFQIARWPSEQIFY